MSRTVRYFGKIAESLVLMILVIAFVYSIFFGTMLDMGKSIFCSMIFIMGAAMLFGTQSTYARLHVPLILSMGATRKESFWGIQLLNLLVMVQTILLLLAASYFTDPTLFEILVYNLQILAGVLIALAGFGEIVATAMLKFEKWGRLILFVVVIGGCAFLGGFFSFFISDGVSFVFSFTNKAVRLIPVVAPLFYVAGAILEWLMIRRYEVQK